MSGPTMFRCEGCIFYKPEGWMIVYAYGRRSGRGRADNTISTIMRRRAPPAMVA